MYHFYSHLGFGRQLFKELFKIFMYLLGSLSCGTTDFRSKARNDKARDGCIVVLRVVLYFAAVYVFVLERPRKRT